jgi:hypothetical protein
MFWVIITCARSGTHRTQLARVDSPIGAYRRSSRLGSYPCNWRALLPLLPKGDLCATGAVVCLLALLGREPALSLAEGMKVRVQLQRAFFARDSRFCLCSVSAWRLCKALQRERIEGEGPYSARIFCARFRILLPLRAERWVMQSLPPTRAYCREFAASAADSLSLKLRSLQRFGSSKATAGPARSAS